MSNKTTDGKDLSLLQERVLQLFLRLCGYFPVGFVLHCRPDQGTVAGEIDTLAVRFPYQVENGTGNVPPGWLSVPSEKIDFLVCEAKLSGRNFNASVQSPDQIAKIIQRFGMLAGDSVDMLARQITPAIGAQRFPRSMTFPTFDISSASAQLRFLVFRGDTATSRRGPYIYADEVLSHIHACFDPKRAPPTCGRSYPTEHWWPNDDIVRVMKEVGDNAPPSSLRALRARLKKSQP